MVIVDPWNYHWCMTWTARAAAMTARMNRALACARLLVMQVVWAPSDVAGMYVGWPQRERALAVKLIPLPERMEEDRFQVAFSAPVAKCLCGPGIHCLVNYGWDGMNPDLHVADQDLIISSTEEIYALLVARGITHLIYMGGATNMCLFGKPRALRFMVDAGMTCMLARDLNEAMTSYDPDTGFTPDDGTRLTGEDLEKVGIRTIDVVEEWRKAGVWNDEWVFEVVRIAPWGQADRPYFFTDSVTVTLSTPHLEDVEIRYTLDDREPTAASTLYREPLRLAETTTLHVAAYRGAERASLGSAAFFVRLPPLPPKPDVSVDALQPLEQPYLYPMFFWPVTTNWSHTGAGLRIRGVEYEKGVGMRAPAMPATPSPRRTGASSHLPGWTITWWTGTMAPSSQASQG